MVVFVFFWVGVVGKQGGHLDYLLGSSFLLVFSG